MAHNGWVTAIAWSPNGRFIASGGEDGIIKVWDSTTCELLNTLIGHRDSISSLIWKDDERLISSASDGSKLWNSKKEQRLVSIPAWAEHAWLPTGRGLITWHPELGKIKLDQYDLRNNNELESTSLRGIEVARDTSAPAFVEAIDIDPSGKLLAVATDTKAIEIWNLLTKQRSLEIKDLSDGAKWVAWSPDGKMLATSVGRSFKVWNSATGEKIATLDGGDAGPHGFAGSAKWSPDGSRLATITYWGCVCLWDVKHWELGVFT